MQWILTVLHICIEAKRESGGEGIIISRQKTHGSCVILSEEETREGHRQGRDWRITVAKKKERKNQTLECSPFLYFSILPLSFAYLFSSRKFIFLYFYYFFSFVIQNSFLASLVYLPSSQPSVVRALVRVTKTVHRKSPTQSPFPWTSGWWYLVGKE